jgi:hypothetical protein
MMHMQAQEVTMLSWSNCSAVLAAATVKGNLQLYFVKERRKMPVAAKHTKRVCAGSWALHENILALAAQDRMVGKRPRLLIAAAGTKGSTSRVPSLHAPAGLHTGRQQCWLQQLQWLWFWMSV